MSQHNPGQPPYDPGNQGKEPAKMGGAPEGGGTPEGGGATPPFFGGGSKPVAPKVTMSTGGADEFEIDIRITIRPKKAESGPPGAVGGSWATCGNSCPVCHTNATCGDSCPVCHTNVTCGNSCPVCPTAVTFCGQVTCTCPTLCPPTGCCP